MRYLLTILKHKWFVLLAGFEVGRIPFWRLLLHDWSKFSPTEFRAYRQRFIFQDCPEAQWKIAWLHHIHRNPHHWQYWILKDEPLPMPEAYVREMVADWIGAGRSYAGASNIQDWLNQEFSKMSLHPETVAILERVLAALGLKLPPRTT